MNLQGGGPLTKFPLVSRRQGNSRRIQERVKIGSLQQSPSQNDGADALRVTDVGKRIVVEQQ